MSIPQSVGEILESMNDAFVALDRDWRYVYVNRRAGEMFGRVPADLIGRHIWTEFPEGVGQPFHLVYERAMRDQQPATFEEHYEPYGRWYENRLHPSPDGLMIFFTASPSASSPTRSSHATPSAIGCWSTRSARWSGAPTATAAPSWPSAGRS